MKLKVLIIIFCSVGLNLYAQSSLNEYKYVIVPKQFDFQKVEDKYQLNSLTKFLFDKEGFTTLFDGDKMPKELFNNPCLGLKARIKDQSKMFATKVVIELLDCRNAVIFTSIEGRSKEKEYKKGYQEAVRRAFESVKALDYKYDSSLATTNKPLKEAEKLAVIPLVEGMPLEGKVTNTNGEELIVDKIDTKEEEKVEEIKEEVSQTHSTAEENTNSEDMLYAQAKPVGYQLVDSAPSVVYLLQKTSIKNVFILKNKNGIIHKKDDKWVAEYYENDELIQKELNIKF